MMRGALSSLDQPIEQGTTGVVVLAMDDVASAAPYPCIRCGSCLEACPIFLDPQKLADLAKKGRYEEMEANNLLDCMLCGSCSYVCPSKLPLAQLFSASKAQLRKRKAAAS
jgi:electron transport complex protein RnfC